MRSLLISVLLGLPLTLLACPANDDDDVTADDDDATADDDDDATADDDDDATADDDDDATSDDDDDDDVTSDDDDDSSTGEDLSDAQLFSCMGNPGSFKPEYEEGDCPTTCAGNTPPTLATPIYRVNGLAQNPLAAVPGDHVDVLIAYEDAECNVACGTFSASYSTPDIAMGDDYSLPSNMPCETAGSNVYLGFSFGKVVAGDHAWALRIYDYCSGETPLIEDTFTI